MTQWGLDTLFNPAKRHMDEEKRRLQSTREQLGDSSGGKRIDLESGKVTIRRDAADDEASAGDPGADATDASAADPGDHAPAAPAAEKPKPAPSPAAIRAAQRRGRQPR
ncbi:MAG: DUF6191 domain-containing protein [Jatrophihabitans sp.]|uniref:DUF6191 domain-containing protein n=1 Tax=Jatrophihabitans sp. TaxID=1932789 RepID=UPI003912CB1B